MINFQALSQIQNVIMYKKFEYFLSKYSTDFESIDVKWTFYAEFNIQDSFSEEYILFLDYLIYKNNGKN